MRVTNSINIYDVKPKVVWCNLTEVKLNILNAGIRIFELN